MATRLFKTPWVRMHTLSPYHVGHSKGGVFVLVSAAIFDRPRLLSLGILGKRGGLYGDSCVGIVVHS